MSIKKSECSVKLLILRGLGRSPQQFCRWQGTRGSETTKSFIQHDYDDFIDHCSLSSTTGIQREIKVKGQKLGTKKGSNTLEQLFHIMALETRSSLQDCTGHCCFYKTEVNLKRQQHVSKIQGETDVLLVISICCMPVNQGPLQQS